MLRTASTVLRLIRAQRQLCEHWAAAWFAREHNTDADILSHPARADEVVARAVAAGLKGLISLVRKTDLDKM